MLAIEQHPHGKHLARAAALAPGHSLTIPVGALRDAKRLAAGLANTRRKKLWALSGTFDPTPVDPRGVGLGMFDAVRIGVRDNPPRVVLTNDPEHSRAARVAQGEAYVNMERVTDANTGRPPIVGDCILTAGPDGRDIGATPARRRGLVRRLLGRRS